MATIQLGKIKQVWRGTYNNSTAYTVDDLVAYTDTVGGLQNTSTYICVTNSTGNAPASGGTVHGSWNLVAQGVPDRLPAQNAGTADKVLISDGSSVSWGQGGKIKQIKDYINTSRGTPTGTGTYLNWGSFQKLGGTETDLYVTGTIHAHDQHGNNVGNPAIVWNGNYKYTGWVRTFSGTSYQLGFAFAVTYSSLAAGTSDFTWYVPSNDHRWQQVVNPNNSDNGVSSRYSNAVGSTLRVIEYIR